MRFFDFSSKFAGILCLALGLSSCGKLDTPESSGGTLTPGSPVVVASQIFSVNVGTIWESDNSNSVTSQGTCTFPNDGTTSTSCTVTIPEFQLFFSKLKIAADVALTSKCQVFEMHPYYFLMSTSAGFSPSWAGANFSAIDCTQSATNASCWGGAAATLSTLSFPSNFYHYYPSSVTSNLSWTFDSANTVRTSRNYSGTALGNRWTVNDLVDRASGIAGQYAGSSTFQDWQFVCVDLYGETQYSLTLNLRETNSTSDNFPTWQ